MCFKKRPSNVDPGIQPDWYLKPSEVWEIRGADISLSYVQLIPPRNEIHSHNSVSKKTGISSRQRLATR